MATDEDHFRIRPGRVRDRAGGAHHARRPAAPEDLPGRGASGYPARWRRPQSAGFGREGKRPVQRARPGRYGRRRAEGPERLEPGRQRRANPRPACDGEGADREAQPAARRGARTVVRQREGGGRPPSLFGARWRQPRRREGAGLFGRARRRGWQRLPRPGPRRPPPVPLHRLRRGRRRAGRLAGDHPRPDEDDGGRSRNQARLDRGRSPQHRPPAHPHPAARRYRRREDSQHRRRLHRPRHPRTGQRDRDAGTGPADRAGGQPPA